MYSPEQMSFLKSYEKDKDFDETPRNNMATGKGLDKSGASLEPPEIGQNEMLSYLLDEFPQLKLSKEMAHVLWKKQVIFCN